MEYVLEKGRPKGGRLEKEMRLYDLLDALDIRYERVDHEAARTMEDCLEIDKVLAPAVIFCWVLSFAKIFFYAMPRKQSSIC